MKMMPDRFWRSILYVPGDNPSMIQKCEVYGADAVVLDLEDAVGFDKKEQARYLVKNALESIGFESCDVMVRINSISSGMWKRDLSLVDLSKVEAIRLPKTEFPYEINELSAFLAEKEERTGLEPNSVKIIPGIETAKGYLNAEKIINVCERVVGIGFGSEDFMTDTGISRDKLSMVKINMVLVAKAYGKCVIDSVYPNFSDKDGFERECRISRECGMDGKSLIHPSQVDTANMVFSPCEEEIGTAREIISIYREKKDGNAFNYNGQMIDRPIVERCERILRYGEFYE